MSVNQKFNAIVHKVYFYFSLIYNRIMKQAIILSLILLIKRDYAYYLNRLLSRVVQAKTLNRIILSK